MAVPPHTGPESSPLGRVAVPSQLQIPDTWMPTLSSSTETRVRLPADADVEKARANTSAESAREREGIFVVAWMADLDGVDGKFAIREVEMRDLISSMDVSNW